MRSKWQSHILSKGLLLISCQLVIIGAHDSKNYYQQQYTPQSNQWPLVQSSASLSSIENYGSFESPQNSGEFGGSKEQPELSSGENSELSPNEPPDPTVINPYSKSYHDYDATTGQFVGEPKKKIDDNRRQKANEYIKSINSQEEMYPQNDDNYPNYASTPSPIGHDYDPPSAYSGEIDQNYNSPIYDITTERPNYLVEEDKNEAGYPAYESLAELTFNQNNIQSNSIEDDQPSAVHSENNYNLQSGQSEEYQTNYNNDVLSQSYSIAPDYSEDNTINSNPTQSSSVELDYKNNFDSPLPSYNNQNSFDSSPYNNQNNYNSPSYNNQNNFNSPPDYNSQNNFNTPPPPVYNNQYNFNSLPIPTPLASTPDQNSYNQNTPNQLNYYSPPQEYQPNYNPFSYNGQNQQQSTNYNSFQYGQTQQLNSYYNPPQIPAPTYTNPYSPASTVGMGGNSIVQNNDIFNNGQYQNNYNSFYSQTPFNPNSRMDHGDPSVQNQNYPNSNQNPNYNAPPNQHQANYNSPPPQNQHPGNYGNRFPQQLNYNSQQQQQWPQNQIPPPTQNQSPGSGSEQFASGSIDYPNYYLPRATTHNPLGTRTNYHNNYYDYRNGPNVPTPPPPQPYQNNNYNSGNQNNINFGNQNNYVDNNKIKSMSDNMLIAVPHKQKVKDEKEQTVLTIKETGGWGMQPFVKPIIKINLSKVMDKFNAMCSYLMPSMEYGSFCSKKGRNDGYAVDGA